MNEIIDWVQSTFGISPLLLYKSVLSFFIIFAVLILRFIILRVASKQTENERILYRWRKSVTYVLFFLAFVLAGRIWFEGIQTLSTFLGLLSAGLAIALQVPIANLAGWAFILWRRPFEVGDRIEIGQVKGDIIDQRIFMFTMMEIGNWVDADQSTGRVIHVPNGRVFQEHLANYSKGFQYIWHEIPVLITFESDWKNANEILLKIANSHAAHLSGSAKSKVKKAAHTYLIHYNKLTPTVYLTVKDSGVLLTLRFLCEPRKRRSTEQNIWKDILTEFAKFDTIDFAYPTRRLFNNPSGTILSSIKNEAKTD